MFLLASVPAEEKAQWREESKARSLIDGAILTGLVRSVGGPAAAAGAGDGDGGAGGGGAKT